MAETIDEAVIIAWVDGELDDVEAARVAQAVEADPELSALADRHRQMKTRFAAAFDPITETTVAMPAVPTAPVISLAAVRAERETTASAAKLPQRWWGVGSAVAASLVVGVLVGHGMGGPAGVIDKPDALALSSPIARALDDQLSGDGGAVRVALSFQDRDGRYCRSFSGQNFSGIACRDRAKWQLRYVAPASAQRTDYRMAGGDTAQADVVSAMIAGNPLDRSGEEAARKAGWRSPSGSQLIAEPHI
jgi:hypothetical protein